MSQAQKRQLETEIVASSRDLDQLYRDHRSWLVRFLHRRFGGLVAEDLAQDAFARALKAKADIRNPRAFLVRVAVNAAIDQAHRAPPVAEGLQTAPDVLQAYADQPEALLLKQLILKLPPDLRQTFLLSRFGGLSNVEIAERCNLSVKRVEARLTKARAICAALMRD